MAQKFDWQGKGFARPPLLAVAPAAGLLLYRAWGASSTEWGSGYFSLEKPASVLDAELRFNIADWGNGVHFVSVFRLREGHHYYVGPVAHGGWDLSAPGMQVFVPPPLAVKMILEKSKETLRHDFAVVQRAGRA